MIRRPDFTRAGFCGRKEQQTCHMTSFAINLTHAKLYCAILLMCDKEVVEV